MGNYDVIIETDEKGNLIIDVFPDYESARYLKISLLSRGDVDDERKIRIVSGRKE